MKKKPTKKTTMRVVKGWAVITERGAFVRAEKSRNDALIEQDILSDFYATDVVPCTITYTLPKKK